MSEADEKPHHFLRQWRQSKDLTLEQVAERIVILSAERRDTLNDPTARPRGMTHATLSRIERGKLPYSQPLLEMLGEIYQTDPASLLMRDPSDPEGLWSIYDQLNAAERARAVAILKATFDQRAA